ncbi:C4-dicarboxylate TRAP transporter substrate-binding protein [Ferrovibrio sp.]|uniref:C4-dicarboxylate TRAP transporter substrate-binding protein n=1 Tax=Ferrovibrio sp. TaxID=1917215 RepID=UPI001B51747E|nr:C4-dicarboxylate TRAP transporter substrate-binding protein [Ferrovibrio sp.]MBP7065792.1 C4-dicarboxylate TRAP transporter substrate-binding protein [Ferrovibrio sp.]
MLKAIKLATCAALLATLSGAAMAQQSIKVAAVSGYPPQTSWVKVFKDVFMAEVDKSLAASGKYKVAWNEGFSGTVAKPRGEFDAVQTGLADIGMIVTAFHPDKVPLYALSFMTPFVTSDLGLVARTVDGLHAKFPQMGENWSRYNQVVLAAAGAVDDYIIVTAKPVRAPEDLKGMKIIGAGLALRWFEGTGGIGVQGNLSEYYNAVQTKLADGAMVWAESAATFKMNEVAPYYLEAGMGGTTSFALTVNRGFWNKLPPEAQKAFKDAAAKYRDGLAAYSMENAEASRKKFVEGKGEIIKLSDENRKRWASQLPNLAKEWAEQAEKQKLPGKAMLTAYMDAMRAAKQPIARHWDRE